MFTNLNKSTKLFNVEVENPIFKKIKDFQENECLQVLGCYTNKKSVYGDEPIFIVKDVQNNIFFVNMPKHHLETLNQIINNADLVAGVNNGECFIKIITYFSKRFNKQCFDFEFVAIEDFNNFKNKVQSQGSFTTQDVKEQDIF